MFESGNTAEQWALMATPGLVVHLFVLLVVGVFSPHIQGNTNWSLIPALRNSSKHKQGNSVEITFGVTDGVAVGPDRLSDLV